MPDGMELLGSRLDHSASDAILTVLSYSRLLESGNRVS